MVFAAALLAGVLLRLWLLRRQMAAVFAHREQVPAAFSGTISQDEHRKAARYTMAKGRLEVVEIGWSCALLLGWTLLGGLHALNLATVQWLGHGLVQQLVLFGLFAAVGALLDAPFAWYRTFRLEQSFGFNRTTYKLWYLDMVRSALLLMLLAAPLLALLLWCMETAGALWWLWAWGLWIGFNVLLLLIYPTWIAPLFNRFSPLEDDSLRQRVSALMHRAGFAAKGFFVMDGSRRSAHANAYFTGLGSNKRVVFYDTLLARLAPGEVEAVLAHELGHFKHRHVLKRLALSFAGSFLGFALLGWLASQAWFYVGLGVVPNMSFDLSREPPASSALALLLFAMAMPVFSFFLTPIWTNLSRRHEFEADRYASELASGSELASALVKLYQDNAATLTPDAVYARFYYSHPPASERLQRLQLAT